MKKAITYRSPRLYSFAIKFLHPRGDLSFVGNLVGKHKTVFEPACGFGRLKKFLDVSCNYFGIDLNYDFIRFGNRRHRNITLGNIFEERHYFKTDIIVLCDIIHHLSVEKGKELVRLACKYAEEKVIIVEPTFTELASGKSWFSKLMAKIFSKLDYDGINHIKKWMTRNEYEKLFREYKVKNNFSNMKVTEKNNYFFVELFANT